jgi:hypothetical protein
MQGHTWKNIQEPLAEKIKLYLLESCLENNAILLTADSSMYAFASGKNVFTIFI